MNRQIHKNKIEWKEVELKDLFKITSSKRVFKSEWKREGIPFYRAREIVKLSEEGFVNNELFISEKMYLDYKKKYGVPNEGDIMVTGVGTLGVCYIVRKDDKFYFKDGNILWLKKKGGVNPKYVKYAFWLPSIKRWINASSGTTVGTFTIVRANKTRIPMPFSTGKLNIKEQERIVKILEKSEELTNKSKKAEEFLDEYLKSVFCEMFYNKGFEEKKGKELFELVYGKGLSKKERDGGRYSVYGSNGVVGKHSKFLIEGPGVIIGRKGSIGKVNYSKENFWAIDTTYYIKPLKKINFIYLYYLLKNYNLNINRSTAIPGLNRNDVYAIRFIDPPFPLQEKFASIVEQIERMKENIHKTKQNSEELFNSLMDKGFKGVL